MSRTSPRPAVSVSEPLETRRLLSAYVVSTAGNDTNPGTDAQPWRTLQKAANTVLPGDNVSVRAGNYVGFNMTRDGTATAPIVFAADAGVSITSPNSFTGRDGINLEGADYITIDGFTVNGMSRAGIRSVTNQHVTIRNNSTDSNGTWGIFTGFSDDLLIENNVTSRSATQHGIYVSNSAHRPVLRNNISWGNAACGIHMNGDLSQGGDGMITGALVEGNLIYGNGALGGSGINGDGFTGGVIRNNVLYDNHAGGITLYRIDAAAGPTDNVIVNNTVLMASDARWAVNITNAGTGNTLFNNVLLTNHAFRGSVAVSADSLANFRSDNNVVADRFTTNEGDTVQTLAQWRASTGQDAHSVVATPAQVFASVAGNDYHLATNSPAIDRGATAFNGKSAPTTDRDGNARPAGAAFDAGAYESGAAPIGPAAPSALDVVAVSRSGIILSWTDNADNENGFKIERKTGANGAWAQVATVGRDVTSFTDLSVTAGTNYVYRVRAAGATASSDSAYSNEVSATTHSILPTPVRRILRLPVVRSRRHL